MADENTKDTKAVSPSQTQTSNITISQEQRSYGELASYNEFLDKTEGLLKDRLNKLRDVLNDLKARGKIWRENQRGKVR